jgi:CRISPR-associated protein Cas1
MGKNKSYSWSNDASDEINALLNYDYAILEAEIRNCINALGLDSAIGFLHETTESKTSLVFDLQEVFSELYVPFCCSGYHRDQHNLL